MENINKIIEATIKANDEIKNFTHELVGRSEMFDIMNLKLYSISGYIYTSMENDFPNVYNSDPDHFENFCNENYLFFREWAADEFIDLDKLMKYVRRSSSFYLSNNVADYFNTRDGVNGEVVIDAISDFGNFYIIYNFIKKDRFEINEDAINKWLGEYSYSEDEFFKKISYEISQVSDIIQDMKNGLEDIVRVYEYIKDFKDNQVKYFKEYTSFYEDDLKYLKKKELRKEAAKNKVLENIKTVITDDMLICDGFNFQIDLI